MGFWKNVSSIILILAAIMTIIGVVHQINPDSVNWIWSSQEKEVISEEPAKVINDTPLQKKDFDFSKVSLK